MVMFMWILSYFYPLFAFVGTLVFLRVSGSLVRRFVPKERADRWPSLRANVAFCAPTIGMALLLLFLRNSLAWPFISSTAVWLSLSADALCLAFTALYVGKLRRLRAAPAAFASVKLEPLQDMARWPHARPFHLKLLGGWVLRSVLSRVGLKGFSLVRRASEDTLRIPPCDLKHSLDDDLRYVDVIADYADEFDLDFIQTSQIPHLLVAQSEVFGGVAGMILKKLAGPQSDTAKEEEEVARGEGEGYSYDVEKFLKEMVGVTDKSYPINRALNCALDGGRWEASCNLCANTPQVVATTWKLFHFQDEARLRMVLLFNAADLIQRLIGSFTLSVLREQNELAGMLENLSPPVNSRSGKSVFPPGTTAEWNMTLEWALKNSENPALEHLRASLLTPREDFQDLHASLEPFWQILGYEPALGPGARHTLACWNTLGFLRNKTVGHGTVGLHLKLNALKYVAPLHRYFLAVMRDAAALDLTVYGLGSQPGSDVVGYSRGLTTVFEVEECDLWMRLAADSDECINVSPYLRLYSGRVLLPNRARKGGFEYVDYNAKAIAEPSFITLPVEAGFV